MDSGVVTSETSADCSEVISKLSSVSSQWPPRPQTPPELSPTTRQSIVAMRRMFFDTDDAKLNRCETLTTDLPPADIPKSPIDKVKPPIVNNPLDDKLSDSPKSSVEYQSGNTSPISKLRRLDTKPNTSSLEFNDFSEKTKISKTRGVDSPSSTSSRKSSLSLDDSNKVSNETQNALNIQETAEQQPCGKSDTSEKPEVVSENSPDKGHEHHVLEVSAEIVSHSTEIEVPESLECSTERDQVAEPKLSDLSCPEILVTSETPSHDSTSLEPKSLEITPNGSADSTVEKSEHVVEAINENVVPPVRPKRRFRSPQTSLGRGQSPLSNEEYPEHLNPFGDDDDVVPPVKPPGVSTNPFGSDSEEEEDSTAVTSTPISSPMKTPSKWTPTASPSSVHYSSNITPIRKAPSLNPFGDSDEEEDESPAIPVPLPRNSSYPDPMPFPRSSLRASLRSIDSAVSTSSRKKRPAPPPPTPPSPATTIRSTRSRKTRRAPLPPGMSSSRLSLASDNISLGGDMREQVNLPEQISAVADRITEWVETSQHDSNLHLSKSFTNEDVTPKSLNVTAFSSTSEVSKYENVSIVGDLSQSDEPKSPSQQLFDNERRIEVHAASDAISSTPTLSPVKLKDVSPDEKLADNKEHPYIEVEDNVKGIDDSKFHLEKVEVEENLKDNETKLASEEVCAPMKTELLVPPPKPPHTLRPLEPKIAITNRKSFPDSDHDDRLSNDKKNKNDLNMTRKISGGSIGSNNSSYSLHKSTHGQWRRKKAPAPPLPLNPEQRRMKKGDFPIVRIKQELNDIEIKQQGLERQGVELEARIRAKFDGDASISPYVEDLVLQLFELVNEKNELFRKQAELMYLRRQQHLEEEQIELEKEIRDLMSQPEVNKTDSDKELEEQLIQRLVEVVERRDAIVQCLEMDRIREAEEDRSISAQLSVFTKAMAPEENSTTSPKKKKLSPDRNKKKWYTLGRSPKKSHS